MKNHPLGHFFKPFMDKIDNDPRVQLKIHTWGFYYWTINFPIIAWMYMFDKKLWNSLGLFITLIYSIYANWTSDYTGMSSAQSVINTTDKEVELEGGGIGTGVKVK